MRVSKAAGDLKLLIKEWGYGAIGSALPWHGRG